MITSSSILTCGPFTIESDDSLFPFVKKNEWDFSISLFPVSKYQFENIILKSGSAVFTDLWYRQKLALNPRCSWSNWGNMPWRLFLTGLGIDEIQKVSALTSGCDLPLKEQWLKLYESEGELLNFKDGLYKIFHDNPSRFAGPVSFWISKGLFPLTSQGLLEAVKDGDKISCLGNPWFELFNNIWKPDEPRNVNWDLSKQFIGFRIVKNIPAQI